MVPFFPGHGVYEPCIVASVSKVMQCGRSFRKEPLLQYAVWISCNAPQLDKINK